MKLADLHPIYREALCVWEAFRKAGFSSSEIYVGKHGPEGYFVVALPHLHYGWAATPSGCDPRALASVPAEEVVRDWKAAAELWNTLSRSEDPELREAWESSNVRLRSVEFLSTMLSHGLHPPCSSDC